MYINLYKNNNVITVIRYKIYENKSKRKKNGYDVKEMI